MDKVSTIWLTINMWLTINGIIIRSSLIDKVEIKEFQCLKTLSDNDR